MLKISREHGFTITEMLVSTTVMLLVTGATLTTFKNAVMINDAASQLGDSAQNLRAGTNLLIRDIMMAGRVIGAEGIAMPNGTGTTAFARPGPVAANFNLVTTDVDDTGTVSVTSMNLPSITTGYQQGPLVKGSTTDMITLMTVDEFMPVSYAPPQGFPLSDATISADGSTLTVSSTSPWVVADTVNDTKPIQQGDLILFKNSYGTAIQYVTSTDATHIYFANSTLDAFHFNQRGAPSVPLWTMKNGSTTATAATAWSTTVTTLFRAMIITYYVDNTTTPGTPRLTRQINMPLSVTCGLVTCFQPTALAGVVEDLDLTYDLVDGVVNPTNVQSLPWTDSTPITYNSNQIRKVNIHVGVRSEQVSKPTQDYVRNHINTSVDVRSLASVDRYQSTGEVQ